MDVFSVAQRSDIMRRVRQAAEPSSRPLSTVDQEVKIPNIEEEAEGESLVRLSGFVKARQPKALFIKNTYETIVFARKIDAGGIISFKV